MASPGSCPIKRLATSRPPGPAASATALAVSRSSIGLVFWAGMFIVLSILNVVAGTKGLVGGYWGLISLGSLTLTIHAALLVGFDTRASIPRRFSILGIHNDNIPLAVLLVIAVVCSVFWLFLAIGPLQAAVRLRHVLLHLFFQPAGALAHMILWMGVAALSVVTFRMRRSY